MRRQLIVLTGLLPCLLLFMALTPSLEAPLVAKPTQTVRPLKVWFGDASWYGPTFEGRTTASGELYDMTASTAAHTNLPFGSMVRLINTRTGKSAVVRINDRGPFVKGREMDVSYQVAERLGIINRGVGRLRMELLQLPHGAQLTQ
jgi:rare lipoprotein A (peptidoglycan hydrolase)|nr:septal ring lytic transglycosylase RlpA family protein [Candidatus Acidoferrales bacterium]